MPVRTNRPALRGALLLLGADYAWTEQCMLTLEPTLGYADIGAFELASLEGDDLAEALRLLRLALGDGAVSGMFPVSAGAIQHEFERHEADRLRHGCPYVEYLGERLPDPPFHEVLHRRFQGLMATPVDRPGNPYLAQAIIWPAAQIASGEAMRAALPEFPRMMCGEYVSRTLHVAVSHLFSMAARRDKEGFLAAAAALELCVQGWPPIGRFKGIDSSWALLTK